MKKRLEFVAPVAALGPAAKACFGCRGGEVFPFSTSARFRLYVQHKVADQPFHCPKLKHARGQYGAEAPNSKNNTFARAGRNVCFSQCTLPRTALGFGQRLKKSNFSALGQQALKLVQTQIATSQETGNVFWLFMRRQWLH